MVLIAMKGLSLLSVFIFLAKFVSGQLCVEETLDCSDPVSSIFKIGKDSCTCDNDKHAGALKFADGKLLVCMGNYWARAEFEPAVPPEYGSKFNPGNSCKDIKQKLGLSASDGIYWIKISTAEKGFPVYCDMTGEGWTLVFKFVSGVPKSSIWGTFYSDTPRAEFIEDALSVTRKYNDYYKNRLGLDTQWFFFNPEKVKLALYSGGHQVKSLIFKAHNDSRDFFKKEFLEQSPWDDISSDKTTEARTFNFAGRNCWSQTCRYFEMSKAYGDEKSQERRCNGDIGWLMITMEKDAVCWFEKRQGRQRAILYSKGKTAARYNDDNAIGIAEVLAIFVK